MANSLNLDLTDKVVILNRVCYSKLESEDDRAVLVLGGFGSVNFTTGQALFVHHLKTGTTFRAEGSQVEKLAEKQLTPEEIERIKNPPKKGKPKIGQRKVKHS